MLLGHDPRSVQIASERHRDFLNAHNLSVREIEEVSTDTTFAGTLRWYYTACTCRVSAHVEVASRFRSPFVYGSLQWPYVGDHPWPLDMVVFGSS